MDVEGLFSGGWQRQASLSTLFRFHVWTCVKRSTVFISRGEEGHPLVKSHQTRPATVTFLALTAVVGVEHFPFVFRIFKGLFFSSLITGFCSQRARKGSLSRVSDLTQLTNPVWDLDMLPWGIYFSHPLLSLQRRESICDSEAETNSHEWQISAGHLTLWRTFTIGYAHVTPETHWISPPSQHLHPACSSLSLPLKGSIVSSKNVFVCTKCVFHSSTCKFMEKCESCYFVCKWKFVTPNNQMHASKDLINWNRVWLLHNKSQQVCLKSE